MIQRKQFSFILLLSVLLASTLVWAEDKPANSAEATTALITSVQGNVQILTPSNDSGGSENKMTYEGKKYQYETAKLGKKISGGKAVMTQADGKAKLIYPSGSVVVVGPNSFVGVVQETKSGKEMNLTYGKIRAVVDPTGPLSGLKIKTANAVAGVRGTDLYVAYDPGTEKAVVETIRGKVSVTALQNKQTETVTTSQTLEISKVQDVKPSARPTNQQELVEIQNNSQITAAQTEVQSAKPEVLAQVNAAEQKAQTSILADIGRYDARAAERLQAKSDNSVESLNAEALYVVFQKAPPGPAQSGKDDEQYKKYFDSMGLQKKESSEH